MKLHNQAVTMEDGRSSAGSTKINLHDLPPELFYQIMVFLQPADVQSCMCVCRKWKGMLSAGYFWQNYLTHCFDFDDQKDAESGSLSGMLHELGSAWSFGFGGVIPSPLEDGSCVFMRLPKRWVSGIVHPVEVDLKGVLDYRALYEAVYQLEQLQREVLRHDIVYTGPTKNRGQCPVDVFLCPWDEDELPDESALLDIFGFNRALTSDVAYQCCGEEKFGDGGEAEKLFKCWNCPYARCTFHDVLPRVIDGFASIRVDFHGRTRSYRPCPEIIVTQLSPGWCGGILTGVW